MLSRREPGQRLHTGSWNLVCRHGWLGLQVLALHLNLANVKKKLSFFLKIYLFMAALGFRCCVRAFSSCGERGLLFVVVRGLLIAVASLVAEHGL